MVGAALAAAGWAVVQPGGKGAAARGPATNSAVEFLTNSGGSAPSATASSPAAALDISPAHKSKTMVAGATLMSGRSVCVRLCDGAFFPIAPVSSSADLAGHEASCEETCPDAPTALYIEPTGSDRIEDAVSTTGAPYTALPVALRNRTILDNTCTCHRSIAQGYSRSLLHDLTLRKGDSVMTPKGFVVFQGQKHLPFAREDFVALMQAPMPGDNRAALLAIERASATNPPIGRNGSRLASKPLRPEKLAQ
ncbi:DUF2865 domain-containing protein [Methylocapsa sp. S129]|uniref:DUF2865 domain-containing protein n=1 Tax=Methylocapsa sp. S129 TaxID=1641869 RepID=UPI00131EA118|nr:DUF2865 domain-containing protein [Methylocapsa sp. S129]